ncbi:MAG TPA: response regulator [Drouetiella sp.]
MSSPTILIVEDYPAQQFVFEQLCERFGYQAYMVSSGEDALGVLAVTKYAAVILDLKLPGIDGIETVRRLRETEKGTGRRTPVIGLTSNSVPQQREICLNAGMDDFMSKPFSIEAFRKMLLRWTYDSKRLNMSLITSTPDSDELCFG